MDMYNTDMMCYKYYTALGLTIIYVVKMFS